MQSIPLDRWYMCIYILYMPGLNGYIYFWSILWRLVCAKLKSMQIFRKHTKQRYLLFNSVSSKKPAWNLVYSFFYLSSFGITAVMARWLAGQTAVLTARVRAPHECRFSVQCKAIALPAFYDAITGPTEFIISIVNSVKMVNMPLAWLPILKEGKSLCILYPSSAR